MWSTRSPATDGLRSGVRFHAEHRFDAPLSAVAAVLGEPELYLALRLPDVDPAELVEHRTDGTVVTVVLRYRFAGRLDPIAAGLLGGRQLTWLQELRVDARSGSGTLTMAAEGGARLLHSSADLVLTADGAGTVRHLDGELVVGVPGIGRMAERRIVPGLLGRLDIEAEAVRCRLRER